MSMDDEWQQFERKVISADAHPVQRQEMRRAFHAGGHAILRQLGLTVPRAGAEQQGNPYAEPLGDITDELDALQEELEAFNQLVQSGRA